MDNLNEMVIQSSVFRQGCLRPCLSHLPAGHPWNSGGELLSAGIWPSNLSSVNSPSRTTIPPAFIFRDSKPLDLKNYLPKDFHKRETQVTNMSTNNIVVVGYETKRPCPLTPWLTNIQQCGGHRPHDSLAALQEPIQ